MNNFLPLDRKILDHWVWEDKPFSKGQAWVDLLLLANYKDKKKPIKDTVVTYKRGNVNLSMVQLADRWGWDRRKVKRFLDVLSDDGMVSVNSTTYGTTITIVNYEFFNNSCTTNGTGNGTTDSTTDGTTNVQPMVQQVRTTNKDNKDNKDEECKERENERMKEDTPPLSPSKAETEDKGNTKKKTAKASNPKVFYPNDEKLNQAFLDFMAMRNSIKKPMTDRAITMAMNKLEKLSTIPFSDSMDNDLAIKILEQSTFACWTDLYALKEDRKKSQSSSSLVDEWRNA